jgi:hypothetical protein
MVQHPDRLDEIEGALDRPETQDIGLGILDVSQSGFLRLPLGVAEAGEAQVDGEMAAPTNRCAVSIDC